MFSERGKQQVCNFENISRLDRFSTMGPRLIGLSIVFASRVFCASLMCLVCRYLCLKKLVQRLLDSRNSLLLRFPCKRAGAQVYLLTFLIFPSSSFLFLNKRCNEHRRRGHFSVRNRPFCVDTVIVTPLTVLHDHLAIHRTIGAVFLFPTLGRTSRRGNSISRKPVPGSGTRAQ